MSDEQPTKYQTRVTRKGDNTRVKIPNDILAQVTLADKELLQIFLNERGNIEIEIKKRDPSAIMCMVCNNLPAKRKCINCGRMACSNCFWELGGLCRKCTKMK
jgi:antitoxin component of MazEF toxin-antitoxin module